MVTPSQLSGRYRLEERLAGGGMGMVYAGRDERLGRRVAVKLLKEDLATDPHFVERFRREARAVAALVHPNIASVFDYGQDGGRHYIVMELVPGRDLARLMREEGPPHVGRAVSITAQLCDALGHAHKAGVVHRDVKPGNVIVAAEDHVKVTDFGIARAPGDATLTTAGSVLGTAQYISPEQAADRAVGPPSDVYSAGIVLFELLTGAVPFTGDSPIALALRHVNEEVAAPSAVNPSVAKELDRVVAKATAKDPGARFRDGAEMAAAVRGAEGAATAVLGGITAPTAALGPGAEPAVAAAGTAAGIGATWPPGARGGSSRWGLVLAAIFVVLLVAAAGLVAATVLRQDQAQPRTGGAVGRRSSPTPPPTGTTTESREEVTVPGGIVGSNSDEAESVLRGLGLEVGRVLEVSEEVEEGVVTAVNPPEGSTVPADSTVTLVVSAGPPGEPPASPTESPPAEGNGAGGGDGSGSDQEENQGD
jgi:predicted Ser/Thr protein kinase